MLTVDQAVFALLRDDSNSDAWTTIIRYLAPTPDKTITLADGRILNYHEALVTAIKNCRFPFAFIYELADSLPKDKFIKIDGIGENRIKILARIPSTIGQSSYADGSDVKILVDIGLRMDWDNAVHIPGWKTKSKPYSEYFSRTEIFRFVVESAPTQYDWYAHLGVSLKPAKYIHGVTKKLLVKAGETFTMPNGEKFDGLALCTFAYKNDYQNKVHTLIALAHFTPDLLFSISLLSRALEQEDEDFDMGMLHEETGIDYDALSIGGEDERRALIAAVCRNDLRNFAESALQRRQPQTSKPTENPFYHQLAALNVSDRQYGRRGHDEDDDDDDEEEDSGRMGRRRRRNSTTNN